MGIHQIPFAFPNAADRIKRGRIIRFSAGKFALDARKQRLRHAVHTRFRKLPHQFRHKRRISIGSKIQKPLQIAGNKNIH